MTQPKSKSQPPATPRPRGARPKGETQEIRTQILDSAEQLFAEHGFHGASIRDIASSANVQFALINYHFGSKEELLDRVVERRSSALRDERLTFLSDARARFAGRPIPVSELIRGYVGGFLTRASKRDRGWRNYAQLVAMLSNTPTWGTLISKHFDSAAMEFLKEFEKTYPAVEQERLYQGFFFMVGIMVAVASHPGRIERLSGSKFKASDVAQLSDSIFLFVEGGFAGLANCAHQP